MDIVDVIDNILIKILSLIIKVYKACKRILTIIVQWYKKRKEIKKTINSKYLKRKVKILSEDKFNKIKSKNIIFKCNSDLTVYKEPKKHSHFKKHL